MPKRTEFIDQNSPLPIRASTLETIDTALFNYVKELNINADTNEGYKPVPVIFNTQERAAMMKTTPDIRDDSLGRQDSLVYPLIAVARTSVDKDVAKRGKYYAPIPENSGYDRIKVAVKINQEKTAVRANADSVRRSATGDDANRKTFPIETQRFVYDVYSIPSPVYLSVGYEITLRTEYIQQMNEMASHFMLTGGSRNYFILEHEGHRYEAFIQGSFSQDNNVGSLGTEERIFTTKVNIEVMGYILSEEKIQSAVKIEQTPAEVIIKRERAILSDEIPFHLDEKNKIRR